MITNNGHSLYVVLYNHYYCKKILLGEIHPYYEVSDTK